MRVIWSNRIWESRVIRELWVVSGMARIPFVAGSTIAPFRAFRQRGLEFCPRVTRQIAPIQALPQSSEPRCCGIAATQREWRPPAKTTEMGGR